MICGTVKAAEWTVAAFMDEDSTQSLELKLCGGPFSSAGISISRSVSSSQSVEHRSGKSQSPDSLNTASDQQSCPPKTHCLFVSRYKIKFSYESLKRRRIPHVIKAEGRRNDDPRSGGGEGGDGIYVEDSLDDIYDDESVQCDYYHVNVSAEDWIA